MARFTALPLALVSLFLAHSPAFAESKPPSDGAKQAKRPPTAMHTTTLTVPSRHAAPAPDAKPAPKDDKKAATKPKPPCLRDAVTITRGVEEDRFSLTRCDGSPAPDAVAHLSILARPGSALRPSGPLPADRAVGTDVAPGIRKLDPKLLVKLQLIADHFQKAGVPPQKLHVISGYRPASAGSFHATGKALDFRMDAVSNEELVSFCKTLPDTGCGYYPNSSFVHLDVRDPGAGHVAWIDASGPGEAARYVSSWPPPPEPTAPVDATAKLDLPELPMDEHPADATSMAASLGVPLSTPPVLEQSP